MESLSTFYSPPFPYTKKLHTQNHRFGHVKGLSLSNGANNKNRVLVQATGNEWNGHGELLVDENMIVLRKRIHEMKMLERNYEAPEEWMAWEKQCYTCYCEFICKFVGFLQLGLMHSRPTLAIAILFLITFCVPTSILMIGMNLMEAANGVVISLG